MQIRLQKWLSDMGEASRRAAEKLILDGRVSVNGKTVSELGAKADTESDKLALDGKEIPYKLGHIYLMLHKPEGVVTTLNDPEGRKTVLDLLTGINERVYPVGRLDYDSSGLLLLTNDGEWANKITHPRFNVKKKYAARISGVPTADKLREFKNGVLIDGRKTARCEIKIMKTEASGGACLVHITISEGRNRQIRKMCEVIGHPVLSLKRVAVGGVKVGDLKRGEGKALTEREVKGVAGGKS